MKSEQAVLPNPYLEEEELTLLRLVYNTGRGVGMICFVFDSLCICLTPMRSSRDTAITVLDRYDMYVGDRSDAGVGLGRLCRPSCSYGFRFSVST
jgi:hypothetical protein